MWEIPPICKNILEINIEDEEDDENDKEQEDDNEDENNDSVADLVTDIEQLHELKIVDSSVVENVKARQQGLRKEKIAETGIPTYTKSTTSENDTMPNFVEVKAGNKVVYIRKRSAVWLFNNNERVSSDHIFRVHSKQPNEESKTKLSEVTNTCSKDQKIPVINSYMMVGEICVFQQTPSELRLGRVLQFCKYENRKKLDFKGNYTTVDSKVGVLCTMYTIDAHGSCSMLSSETDYFSTTSYVCTLIEGCIDKPNKPTKTYMGFISTTISLSDKFKLTTECFKFIELQALQNNKTETY